ncbi:MAG: 3-deoxy-manno-octulosonate cytidylyltransferase [Oligoflexia bacterium]|nr:3-deoxy-manno-octulosonate cytidylyltransferase [Oligoflexia bacterium]
MPYSNNSTSKIVILIPARYQSSRFPGKPLATIAGKSMINIVYNNAISSSFDTYVVTDNNLIEEHVLSFGGKVLRVDDEVNCGTDRIHLAYSRFLNKSESNNCSSYSLIINLQGDEPLLKGSELKALGEWHLNSKYDITTLVKRHTFSVTTPATPTTPQLREKYLGPNVVKAVFVADNLNSSKAGRCLYFSRSPIPHLPLSDNNNETDKNNENLIWHQHVGIYSYRPHILETFVKSNATYLEQVEKLEQLRALSIGMNIGALVTENELISVDTPEDIIKVEKLFKKVSEVSKEHLSYEL